MTGNTVPAELLLNSRIRDRHGKVVGAIEEIITEPEGDALYVVEYHTGGAGFIEHLSALVLGGWLLRWLEQRGHNYVIKWNQIDISDPEHPVLTVPVAELQRR